MALELPSLTKVALPNSNPSITAPIRHRCTLKPHPPSPVPSLTGTLTTTTPLASPFASSHSIKLILMYNSLALQCLQSLCSILPVHTHYRTSFLLNLLQMSSSANTLPASTFIMATNKGPALAKSSPHSSEEASHNDTPSTNLTTFSSESAGTATGSRPKFNLILAEPDGTNFNYGGNVAVS